MDKLEKTKTDNTSNDAIVDDVAAKAYIENFALDTFNRADEAQRANKVTRQTADTFMAAATFLDVLNIWGEMEKETAAKSKFAKFHAARILKAFKAGEDPNATNPVVEEPPALAEDGMEAELKDLENQQNGTEYAVYQPPTVVSAPDSGMPSRPQSALPSDKAVPPALPRQMSSDMPAPSFPQQPDYQVSPIEPADNSTIDAVGSATVRQNSAGGGYFPAVPSAPADVDMADPGYIPMQSPQESMDPQDFYNTASLPPTAPSAPTPGSRDISSPARPYQPPVAPPVHLPAAQAPAPVPLPAVAQQAPFSGAYRTDDESTMAAQKHARWAISALNFEDVNTAVKELRLALQDLGAG